MARAKATTRGRWTAKSEDPSGIDEANGRKVYHVRIAPGYFIGDLTRADAKFIAHARADIAALVAECQRLRAALPVDDTAIDRMNATNQPAPPAPLVVHVRRGPYDAYVGRPNRFIPKSAWGPYGNPFDVRTYGLARALALYAAWIREPAQAELRQRMRSQLRGKILGCWCAPRGGLASGDRLACHAQIIAAIAASESDAEILG